MFATLTVDDLLIISASESGKLADEAERVLLSDPVPTCPEWTVRQLVEHLGGVHRWATMIISEGLLQPGRSSLGTETVPTYRPGEVRTLDPGRVLVIHRNLDPILARAVDVSRREDWRQIRRDVDVIRSGYVEVDAEGFAA